MVDWSLGYTARYYMSSVHKTTMRDTEKIEITGGSITRSSTELRESASVDCVNYDSSQELIVRIWLDAKQGSESSHIPLFTGLASCPSDRYNGRLRTNTLECYSMLKIAQDILLPRGWYAPVDANSGLLIKDLLGVLNLPPDYLHIPEVTPNLTQSIIAGQGETRLSMVEAILSAMGNWRLRLDGYGAIYVEEIPKNVSAIFDANDNDVLETSVDLTYDWYSAPNVVRCILNDSYAEARDDNPDSPLSVPNRGREVWVEVNDVQLSTDETLSEYAQRALKYLQQISTSVNYTRRFDPDVYPSDLIRINYPGQNINGIYRVTHQTISLGYNARTSEEVITI